eukprot:CAMPEP_0181349562 /NCGR_PEP_ID=MMETSP1106-20121128/794_1 /TAXON_ID=81844 /ORGANISM="Mantoniella antarctica, Strain SL-175" /LENGTH=84 /DNA_ID=CAMNT_0023461967 /DNA_START=255 /DNA_END=510 /DNA_ORIENTATION=+
MSATAPLATLRIISLSNERAAAAALSSPWRFQVICLVKLHTAQAVKVPPAAGYIVGFELRSQEEAEEGPADGCSSGSVEVLGEC